MANFASNTVDSLVGTVGIRQIAISNLYNISCPVLMRLTNTGRFHPSFSRHRFHKALNLIPTNHEGAVNLVMVQSYRRLRAKRRARNHIVGILEVCALGDRGNLRTPSTLRSVDLYHVYSSNFEIRSGWAVGRCQARPSNKCQQSPFVLSSDDRQRGL